MLRHVPNSRHWRDDPATRYLPSGLNSRPKISPYSCAGSVLDNAPVAGSNKAKVCVSLRCWSRPARVACRRRSAQRPRSKPVQGYETMVRGGRCRRRPGRRRRVAPRIAAIASATKQRRAPGPQSVVSGKCCPHPPGTVAGLGTTRRRARWLGTTRRIDCSARRSRPCCRPGGCGDGTIPSGAGPPGPCRAARRLRGGYVPAFGTGPPPCVPGTPPIALRGIVVGQAPRSSMRWALESASCAGGFRRAQTVPRRWCR